MPGPQPNTRDAAVAIVRRLSEHGHVAYLAGGCVRDALLGRAPKDYDVTTDAPPDIVRGLFQHTAAVGEAFGVVLVYVPGLPGSPRHTIEVATFRAESGYTDGRHPDQVRFTNAEEDAKRRDFTINGLFADPAPTKDEQDRIIDFVGGQNDLERGIIRAIGDPSERFGEDYLRMLRAVRFAARLGFVIDPVTSAALRAHARYLGQISRERIGQELQAMLTGPAPAQALELLQDHKLDGPTLNEDHQDIELPTSRALPHQAGYPARLAGWLIDRHGVTPGYTRVIERWRKALSLSNDTRDTMKAQLTLLNDLNGWEQRPIAQRKRRIARPVWAQTLLLYAARRGDAGHLTEDAERLASDGIGIAPQPLITGDDLIALGLKPGPKFKTLLDQAYDRQVEGDLMTRDQALGWLEKQSL
ncbi:MAG: CCA tRNA nucleotidyltransferase [Planctomycetota bacterium]